MFAFARLHTSANIGRVLIAVPVRSIRSWAVPKKSVMLSGTALILNPSHNSQ